jgi:hypothetical protein
VVGVHSPEFAYEKLTRNVQDAIERFHIRYPVAQDNSFATWKAYYNQYWPAFYLVDSKGQVMRQHFGEGEYAEMEAAIEALLAAARHQASCACVGQPARLRSAMPASAVIHAGLSFRQGM